MTKWVRMLLFANIGVFFVQQTMPEIANAFAFIPSLILVRPWTVVTYMFLHGGLMHLLFNMLALFFFGPRVEERLGSRPFATMYFVAGISGALLSLVFGTHAAIIGASGGVFGVMLAFAYFWPDAPIMIWGILPIPARILVIITTVLALYSGLQGSRGGVADFAHLGGYAGAYLYLKWLERGRGSFKKKAVGITDPVVARILTKKPVVDIASVHEVNRDEVNRILDKINAQGMQSLTNEERVFLAHFAQPDDKTPPVS